MISPATRCWLAAGRSADLAHRVFRAARDEWMLCYVPEAGRDAVTACIYSGATEYMPEGVYFEQGFFAWEKHLLARAELPRGGRVLLPGAGAGREAKAFLGLGFAVSAFDPSPGLGEQLRALAAGGGDFRAAQASYADLVSGANGGGGPLADWSGPYDLAWLGWGSFTHVTSSALQLEVLRSIRRMAPRAPVVLSFYLREAEPAREGGIRRLRRSLRRAFSRFGGTAPLPGVEFWDNVGFTYAYTPDELGALFHAAGYEAAVNVSEPYPHALLLPVGNA